MTRSNGQTSVHMVYLLRSSSSKYLSAYTQAYACAHTALTTVHMALQTTCVHVRVFVCVCVCVCVCERERERERERVIYRG